MASFQRKVLELTAKIPRGKISTYGRIARILKTSPRAVGQALSKNPYPIKIPCHRVVKSDGMPGGYSGGANKKVILLRKEGIIIKNKKINNFSRVIYEFKNNF